MASEQEEGLEDAEAEFDEEYAAAEADEAEDEGGGGSSDEDGAAGGSFQSADDDDDFDLPQDFAPDPGCEEDAAAPGPSSSGGALPPGLDDSEGAGAERWNLKEDGNKEQLEGIFQRLCGDREHVKISKMFSYVLRHAAHKLDVRIRKDGFVRLREIMKLRNFKPYQLEELMAVVYFDEKERYTMVREFDGELLIRANQGHTMKVVEDDLLLENIVEPNDAHECVHGTYLVHWPFIKRQGLSKVARNHIHLASGLPEDGKIRGMRSTAELFIYLNVRSAMEDGVVFYRSKNDVILTQGFDGWLPVKYFVKAVRIDYNTCDIEELEFDRDMGGIPQWPAELAPSGPGEQGTYLIKNLEALISNCRKRMQEINELKALKDRGTELDEEDEDKISKHAQVYTELQSLEQRFRQHKGFRRDNAQDKEQRAKEMQEATTVVKRRDRALTPPWLKGKVTTESASMRSTEKEKAEWAALGRRRDTATEIEKKPKKEDQWSVLGRGRQSAPPTPAGGSGGKRGSEAELWRSGSGALPREGGSRRSLGGKGKDKGAGRAEEERRGGHEKGSHEDKMRSGGNAGDDSSTAAGNAGPPRFFNSRKSGQGPSWRDRMTNPKSSGDERRPSPQPSQDSEPSWRDQMQDGSDTWNEQGDQQMWGEVATPATHGHDPAWRDQGGQPQLQEEQSWRRPTPLGQTMHAGPPGQDALQTPTHRDFPPPPPQVPAPTAMPPNMPNQSFHLVMQSGSGMTTMVPSQMQSPMSPQGGGMVQVLHGPGPGPSSPGGNMQGMMQNQFAMPMNSGGSSGCQLAGTQSPCNGGNVHDPGTMQPTKGGIGASGPNMDSSRGGYIAVPVWQGNSMQAGQQACNLGSAQPQMFCPVPSPTGGTSPMAPASWLGPAPQASQFVPPPPPDAPPEHSPQGTMLPPPPNGPSGGQCMGGGNVGDSTPMQQQQQRGQGVVPGGAGVMPGGGNCRAPMQQQTPRTGFGSNRARFMQLQQCPSSGYNFDGPTGMGNDGGGMQLHHIPGGGNFGCGSSCGGGGGDFPGMSSPNYGYGCDGRMAMDASPMSPMSYCGEDSMQGPGGCFGCGGCGGCMEAQSDMHQNRATGGTGYPMQNWEPVTPHTPQMKGGGCRYQSGGGTGADGSFMLPQQPYGDFDDVASFQESGSHGPSWGKGGGGGKTPQHGGSRNSGSKGSKKGGKGKGGGEGGGKSGRGKDRDRGNDSQDWAAIGRLRAAA